MEVLRHKRVYVQSPAGGSLVDFCCLSGSSGGLCVAAAGKWAVCLWGQTSASDWTLLHTWSFSQVSMWAKSFKVCLLFSDIYLCFYEDILVFGWFQTFQIVVVIYFFFNLCFLVSSFGDKYVM